MQLCEFHVIDRGDQKYIFMPELKLFCKVTDQIGQALSEYEKTRQSTSAEHAKILEDFAKGVEENMSPVATTFETDFDGVTLMLATNCNLRCTYCYADAGTYKREKELMSVETALQAIKTAFRLSKKIKNVRFFGGEPLLNFEVIKAVCQYISDELGIGDMKYNLETNGTLMTEEFIETLEKYKVDINISYDGPKEYHDRHRVYVDGTGTYEKVLETIQLLKERGLEFAFQCTYTDEHRPMAVKDLEADILQHTPYYKITPCQFEDGHLAEMDHSKYVLEALDSLATEEPVFHSPTLQYLAPIVNTHNNRRFCEAQCRFAVFPDGGVYPCELLDQDLFYMGNIHDTDFPGEKFEEVRARLMSFNRDVRLNGCWFRFLPNPICIAALLKPDFDLDQAIKLPQKLADFYEDLIVKVLQIQDSDKWEIFLTNIKSYYYKRG